MKKRKKKLTEDFDKIEKTLRDKKFIFFLLILGRKKKTNKKKIQSLSEKILKSQTENK